MTNGFIAWVIILVLSACEDHRVTTWDAKASRSYCADKGGVDVFRSNLNKPGLDVKCMNGSKIHSDNIVGGK